MRRSNRWLVAVLIVAGLPVSASSDTARKGGPAKVEPIPGTDVKRVVLTEKAAERLGIETAPVREARVLRKRVVVAEVVAMSAESGSIASRSANSPVPQTQSVAPRKVEASGRAPSEAADRSIVGVRVRLSEGALKKVARGEPARILRPGRDDDDDDEEAGLPARPVEMGAAHDPKEPTTALYYVADSAEHGLVPGQRVHVRLALLGKGDKRKVIPYSAVLYDLNGDTWVYTNPEPLAFVRHEVDIDYVEGDVAVLEEGPLEEGPPIGTKVVTVGATLLWSVETGFGKAK